MIAIITVLLLSLLSAGCVWGFSVACRFEDYEEFDEASPALQKNWPKPKLEGAMVLWWVRYYLAPVLGPFWAKPVYKCMICMASLHSILPVLLFGTGSFLITWPFVILFTAGFNAYLTYNFNTR
jgi:hypothetical protein